MISKNHTAMRKHMKTLYIIRHAKSDRNDPTLNDFERPLNKRGEKNAPLMGEILASGRVRPDLILSSPAVRAKTTAKIIAEKVGYSTDKIIYEESLYLAERDVIEHLIQKISSSINTIFIVGHNPGLTLFAEYISGDAIGNIPTSGIVAVRLKNGGWKNLGRDSAELIFFEYPKKHKDG